MQLAGPTDWDGFVHATRWLVHAGVAPQDVRWLDGTDRSAGLFDGAALASQDLAAAPPLALPASFVDRARSALLHAEPARFDLLYRLIFRLLEDRRLANDPLDADWLRLESLAKAVRREMHKMKAFVRFRKVTWEASASRDHSRPSDGVRHVAWFEPEHHVVEAVAPFFARRFAQMDWAILTPRVSVSWDRRSLHFGPGAEARDAPTPDADEALWLAYYASIFNPARVKEAMMKKEMPVRFWKNLPEAALIAPLMAAAPERVRQMVEAGASERTRRRASASETGEERRSPQGDGQRVAAPSHDESERAHLSAPPESLDVLASRAAQCRACPIGRAATQTVWGGGAPDARLMLVGEQPGDREDLAGEPFVGPAGKLLRRAFEQLGWPADRLYMTNAVKHFKYELRGKRRIHKTANQREIEICSGWLEAEIAAVKPEALIALGATAARSLLGRAVPIGKNEGEWIEREDGRAVLIARHPAALLRIVDGDMEAEYERWVALLGRATGYVDRDGTGHASP